MSPFRPTSAASVCDDLRAFAAFLEKEPVEIREIAAGELNMQLSAWSLSDAFGTEGQLDPRGDPRE